MYSIIIIKSIEIIKDERNKINIERQKKIKNNKKFKIKVNNKYNDLLKKYTIGWPKNKTLSEKEKIKIKKKAIEYVNNTGSYICSNCNKNIQNRHKASNSNKCLKLK